MNARPLTQAEADAVVGRMGGWDKLRSDNARAKRSSRTLSDYLETRPFDEANPWVGAFETIVVAAPTLDLLEAKLTHAGADVHRSVTYKRVHPDLKVIFVL